VVLEHSHFFLPSFISTVKLKPFGEGRRNSLKRDSFRRKLARNQARQASSLAATSKRAKDHEIASDFTGELANSGEEKASCLFMTQSLRSCSITHHHIHHAQVKDSSRARQGQPPPPPPPSSYQNGQIDSLATQLQKQKIATEGYAQFKQDFGKINSSPGASPSNFQKARKEQFRSKLGMFESQDELSDQASSRQGTLERLGSHEQRGVVDRARASLVNRNNERSSAPQQLVAEKYRRDLQAQVSFPDPPQHDYSQSSSRDLRSQSEHLARPTPVNDSLGARSISAPDDDELFSEVTVCMSQRPGSSRGFGFKVRGGDGVNPIIVDQITPGGAAFVCELSIGDEVISMNGLTVANLTQDQIVELMTEAVRTGQLRLRVRRYSTITRKKPLNQAPSLRLTSAAKMVATEGGFYQILADIPKKPRQTSQQQQQQHARPQQSASPAGTLDSGHGSEQMLEMRESPATRSPVASSTQSSPRHSPRRPVQSEPNNDDNPWLNELGSFELKQSGVSVKAPPQREIYQAKSISPDRSVLRKSLDRQLNNSNVARQLQDALDIEQEENQRELTERIRRQQQRDNDEYTETQIRKIRDSSNLLQSRSSNNNNHTAHWMVREAESRRQQFSVRK